MTAPCPFCATPSAPRRGTLRWCDPCGRWWGPDDVLEQRDRARDVAAAVVESEGAWEAVAERLAAALAVTLDVLAVTTKADVSKGQGAAALAEYDDLRGRVAT